MDSELKVQKGDDKVKSFEDSKTKSGNTLVRHFCSNCVRTSSPTTVLNCSGEKPQNVAESYGLD